jgi:hypothetical protein
VSAYFHFWCLERGHIDSTVMVELDVKNCIAQRKPKPTPYGSLEQTARARMDCQNSARDEKGEAESVGKGLRKETLATRNHRAEGWAQKAPPQDAGIACDILKQLGLM